MQHQEKQAAASSSRSKHQREGAARQSTKVVRWPNSVLVAPFRVVRQNCALAPPQAKCSPFWAVGKHGAAERACRVNKAGATKLLCRANRNGATKGICHATSQKCSPFWTLTLHGATVWLCRANNTGATSLLCRAVGSGFVRDLQPFLVLGSRWRGTAVLSHHPYWRDKALATCCLF